MTEWEGSYPKKTPEQEKKERIQEIKWMIGLIVRIPLVLIMVVGFVYFFFNSYKVSKYFSNMLWILKPNETLAFTKTPNTVPNQTITVPYGWTEEQEGFCTFLTHDEHNIYIYSSLRLDRPLETLEVDGSIKSVTCYYREPSSILGFAYNDSDVKPQDKKEHKDGLLIHCQYSSCKSDRLVVFRIPASAYAFYWLDKNPDFKDIYDLKHAIAGLGVTESTTPKNTTKEVKTLHPGKALVREFDIPFEDREFICFSGESGFIVENIKEYSIDFCDDSGKLVNKFSIGRPFVYDFQYMFSSMRIFTFDGIKCIQYSIGDKLKQDCSVVTKKTASVSESRFIPINLNRIGYADPLLLSGNKIFTISENDYSIITGSLGNLNEIKIIDSNTFKMDALDYHFNVFDKRMQKINVTPMAQFSLFWDPHMPEKMYTNDVIIAGMFISPSIDNESQKPVVYIDYADNLMIADTSGIDEPVDRAYVTYEEGNMAIYFMNDRSIFRWSCTNDEFRMMKFINITGDNTGLLLESK